MVGQDEVTPRTLREAVCMGVTLAWPRKRKDRGNSEETKPRRE